MATVVVAIHLSDMRLDGSRRERTARVDLSLVNAKVFNFYVSNANDVYCFHKCGVHAFRISGEVQILLGMEEFVCKWHGDEMRGDLVDWLVGWFVGGWFHAESNRQSLLNFILCV